MSRVVREGFWQSFADLAMGTMAVIILVLLLVLSKQTLKEDTHRDKFREMLLEGTEIVERQDRLSRLIQSIFQESNCPLRFDPSSGRLRGGDGTAANLYPEGSVALSLEGRVALEKCGLNFLTLVVCFDQRDAAVPTCGRLLHRLSEDDALAAQRFTNFRQLRGQVEAMVLEGNTDRSRFYGPPPISGVRPRAFPSREALDAHTAFVSNAHLGAERARQALGKLAQVVVTTAHEIGWSDEDIDPLDALFGLVSVESGAFGRYQAGPTDARRPGCEDGADACDEARNLSLRLRWTQGSLRRPFDAIVAFYCAELERFGGSYRTEAGDEVICHDYEVRR